MPAAASSIQQRPNPILIAYAQDIVSTAVEAGQFNTLAVALKAAGLIEVLQSDGPFTVFAPTDEAFAALPPGLVEDLLLPENKDELIKILTYHVVPGKYSSGDLESGKVKTVEGDYIYVRVSNAGVKVDDANAIIPDVPATNGVIHVIDSIILPSR
ncbi:MAG: fasciclin domain-containing protein [Cyanobacteria bacterium P01_E01_bin.42]